MPNEKILFHAVLVFPVKPRQANGNQKVVEEVLLAMKTCKIGEGCWNGYGGGVEEGETPEVAAVREFFEESGGATIEIEDLQKVAVADFCNTREDGTSFVCQVQVFLVEKWSGQLTSTETMINPTWFKRLELPFDQLMPADRFWLPLALTYCSMRVKATYGPHQKNLIGPVDIKRDALVV
jgi:8-oxo-dGTP diphosphatase/2-hydroxy-dATP diphosphatase